MLQDTPPGAIDGDFLLQEDDALPPPSLALLSTALATLVDSTRSSSSSGTATAAVAIEQQQQTPSVVAPSPVMEADEAVGTPALIVHCICDFFVDL